MEGSSGENGGGPDLRGFRVLVAEDEALIALDLEAALRDLGCVVPPPAPSTAAALAVLRTERPDAALLDLELADGPAGPVAEALAAAGVPFAVMTGHDRRAIADPTLRAAPYLGKPYGHEELGATLATLARLSARPRRPLHRAA
jgi:DNA-binding response OmpR family regulator